MFCSVALVYRTGRTRWEDGRTRRVYSDRMQRPRYAKSHSNAGVEYCTLVMK